MLLKVLGITSRELLVLMACLPFVCAGGQTSIRYAVFALSCNLFLFFKIIY
jgi:hypothetical protein